jgi:hypothetical protein
MTEVIEWDVIKGEPMSKKDGRIVSISITHGAVISETSEV